MIVLRKTTNSTDDIYIQMSMTNNLILDSLLKEFPQEEADRGY